MASRTTTPAASRRRQQPAPVDAMRPANDPKPNPLDGENDLDGLDGEDDALDVTLTEATDRALAGEDSLDALDEDVSAEVVLMDPEVEADLVLPDDRDPLAPRSIDDLEVGEDDQLPEPETTMLRIRRAGKTGVLVIRLTHRAGCPARKERVESFPVTTPKQNRAVTVRCCDCAAQVSKRIT